MLKSIELLHDIQSLRDEVKAGIAKKLDVCAKAEELDALMAQYQSAVEAESKKKIIKEDKNMSINEKKLAFNRVMKNLLTGKAVAEADKAYMPQVVDTATGQYSSSSAQSAGAYLIPEEFMEMYALNDSIVNLSSLVDQVAVSYPTGKIPTIDYSQVIELADFTNDNDTEIAKKSASFGQTSYTLGTRGAIIKIARELMQDSATDVVGVINKLFARAEIETSNKDILTAAQLSGVNTDTADFTDAAVIDKITEAIGSTLDMAYAPNAKILMCQKDWVTVQNLKDENGQYYVEPIIAQAGKFAIRGHEVVVVPNKYFTTVSGETTTIGGTIIVGDFKQLKKIVRVGYEVQADESAGFNTNSVCVRALARFTVKNMNVKAFVKITHSAS